MKTYRMNAVMTGVLYILGTVFGILTLVGGKVFSSGITNASLVGMDLLNLVTADSAKITVGSFLTMMMGISLILMSVFLYPVLRKVSKEMAMGLILFRGALEGVFYLISVLTFLSLAAVGKMNTTAGSESAVLQTIGNLLLQFLTFNSQLLSIVFVIGGMCIYIAFYRSRLIPRWLTIWGFIGMATTLTSALLTFFNMETNLGFYLEIVLAPQELIMAVWLIVKGFNKSALADLSENAMKGNR